MGSKYTTEDIGTNISKNNFVKTFFVAATLVIIFWDAIRVLCSFKLKLITASCNWAYLSQINNEIVNSVCSYGWAISWFILQNISNKTILKLKYKKIESLEYKIW